MRSVRSVARIAPMVALALVLAACGSDSMEAESAPTQPALEGVTEGGDFSQGYPLPDCSNAGDAPCITNGFDPMRDGFGFANWGEPGNIGATEMIALFGRDNVCASGSGDSCVLFPAAEQWAAQINESMAGGHCEGMAVLSARLFLGANALTQLDPNAQSTFDLDPSDGDVTSAIEMWFATQYLEPVIQAYKSYQKLSPTEIASALIDGLNDGAGYTLGIYSDDGGHAVTPLGVSLEGDQVAISIYDNNYPGTVQRVMIDPDAETWSYAGGTTEPNAPTDGWAGGTGTIELTPMKSRALPAPAPFAETGSGGRNSAKNQTILVTSPDPNTLAGAVLTLGGQTYDLTDPNTTPPSGVRVRDVRGNTLKSGSTVVDIDTEVVRDYGITATTTNPSGATVPVTMSIDAVGKPRISMRAESPSGDDGVATFTSGASGAVIADTSAGTAASVSVANGLRGVSFDLDDDNAMVIDSDEDGVASVTVQDEDGRDLGTYEIDDETADGLVSVQEADFDSASGDFEVTEVEVEAQEVDTDFLAVVDDVVGDGPDAGADDQAGDDAPAGDGTDEGAADDAPVEGDAGDGAPADEGEGDGARVEEEAGDSAPADEAPADEGAGGDGAADDAPADQGDGGGDAE